MKMATCKQTENVTKIINREICPKLTNVPTAMLMYSKGRNSLMRDAAAAQAIIRSGKSVTINIPRMDAYYDALSGE